MRSILKLTSSAGMHLPCSMLHAVCGYNWSDRRKLSHSPCKSLCKSCQPHAHLLVAALPLAGQAGPVRPVHTID